MALIESMTIDQLDQAIFVLECKDHWTEKDWTESAQLNAEKAKRTPPAPKRTQYKVRMWDKSGIYILGQKWFYSFEAAQNYINREHIRYYTIEAC